MVVGQSAHLDLSLRVGVVSEQVTVAADVSPVAATTTDVSGLVGEQQLKNLPLNGRSYDLLTLLNPGVVNFTSEKTGGTGVSILNSYQELQNGPSRTSTSNHLERMNRVN